jgi:hypothetical protein
MAGVTLPSKAFWVFLAAVVVAVSAVAFIVGAFVVTHLRPCAKSSGFLGQALP